MADETDNAGNQPVRVNGRFAKRNRAEGPGGNQEPSGPIDSDAGSAGEDANASGAVHSQEPEAIGDANTTAEPGVKKRTGGWPKGKPRKPRDGSAPGGAANARNAERMDREKAGVLAQQILSFHQIAAMATGIAELQITEFEAGLLAQSIQDLSKHYGPVISGPGMLWLSFAGVAGMIYIPRAQAIRARIAEMRRKRPPQSQDDTNVIQGDFTLKQDAADPFRPGNIG